MGKTKKIPRPPRALLKRIRAVSAKRPKTVLTHILKHGVVTTEELKNLYGYEHAPRAARDVRELGIPLITIKAKDEKGRSIAAYQLDVEHFDSRVSKTGRKQLPRKVKDDLVEAYGSRCEICVGVFDPKMLQLDHRIPYEVGGEPATCDGGPLMLVCGSCNRSKSWACEHCENWIHDKNPALCVTCYWGSPTEYVHIALQQIRRVDVTWEGSEVAEFDGVSKLEAEAGSDVRQAIKRAIRERAQPKKAV